MRGIIALLWVSLLLSSCGEPGDLIIVPDNTSPPDLTVPEIIQENFVNRVYISLLGRKPESGELAAAMSLLARDNASEADRIDVVESVLGDGQFRDRQYNIARINLLNNLDTTAIATYQFVYTQYLTDPQYEPFLDLIHYELNRLDELSLAAPHYLSETIDRAEMHTRMANNPFYDEINMGTQNFVLSVFEHFLNRYPTESEEENAILMSDGFYAVIFGKEGNSQEDFLEILTESDAYLEGQVLDVYESFLFRQPTSQEMAEGTTLFRQNGSYESLLISVLITEEFLGN